MGIARLLLCYVLLGRYGTNLGGATITSDASRQESSSVTNPMSSGTPTFSRPIGNVTAAIGKEAVLTCTIGTLGNYKVGWLRAEDQTILSMGQRTVTHSPRYLVTVENVAVGPKSKNRTRLGRKDEEATWRLHIRHLREADRGCYMCQVNTKPMLSQLGCVDVLVPPDILSSGTSEGEVSVQEGENTTLVCKATGRPAPRVVWRREKSDFLLMRGLHDPLIQVDSQSGERLELTRVDRRQMGAYLCIAMNDVPPAVSKRVYLRVNFSPSAKVLDELLSSPLDKDVSLTCLVEAYPKTINLWTRQSQVIMSGGRYEINERGHLDEEWKTTIELKIRRLERMDLGEYTCSASSSMGQAEATLRVHEIERVTLPTRSSAPNSKKLSKGRSKSQGQVTTINRLFHHEASTPAMQKSTSRLLFNGYTTTTTADPRAPFMRNNNALEKIREETRARSSAVGRAVLEQISTICLTFSLTMR